MKQLKKITVWNLLRTIYLTKHYKLEVLDKREGRGELVEAEEVKVKRRGIGIGWRRLW